MRGPKTGIHPYIATHIAHQDRPPHHGRRRGARGSFSPPYPLLALPLGEQLSSDAHSTTSTSPPLGFPSKGKRLARTGADKKPRNRAPPSRSSSSPPAAATTRTSSPSCSTASPMTKSPRSSTAPPPSWATTSTTRPPPAATVRIYIQFLSLSPLPPPA